MGRYPFRSVVITGASSGIGKALALELAGDGVVLGLAGRNRERLMAVASACEAAGATVVAETFDLARRDAVRSFIQAVDRRFPVDLVIANAGVFGMVSDEALLEAFDQVAAMVETNVMGVFGTVEAALSVMVPRGRGHLAIMGSMSAITPLPHAPAYSATKAAVKAYGEALRPRLATSGIATSVIVPGFVDTPMDRSHPSPKPLRMSAEKSARVILRGLVRKKAFIGFPGLLYVGAILASRAPVFLRDRIMKRMLRLPAGMRR
ncbi:MAG: SDR family NAD(P)-dependent oxidoreductase [Bauldia litoralis]